MATGGVHGGTFVGGMGGGVFLVSCSSKQRLSECIQSLKDSYAVKKDSGEIIKPFRNMRILDFTIKDEGLLSGSD
jgi:hypothetical protein